MTDRRNGKSRLLYTEISMWTTNLSWNACNTNYWMQVWNVKSCNSRGSSSLSHTVTLIQFSSNIYTWQWDCKGACAEDFKRVHELTNLIFLCHTQRSLLQSTIHWRELPRSQHARADVEKDCGKDQLIAEEALSVDAHEWKFVVQLSCHSCKVY